MHPLRDAVDLMMRAQESTAWTVLALVPCIGAYYAIRALARRRRRPRVARDGDSVTIYFDGKLKRETKRSARKLFLGAPMYSRDGKVVGHITDVTFADKDIVLTLKHDHEPITLEYRPTERKPKPNGTDTNG